MAKVAGRALPISTKFSIEICNLIRNMGTSKAKEILQNAIDGKNAIPFKIFNNGLSHKRKIGPGRFPKKAALEIVSLIESAEANAQFKGLNTSDLCITHINAHLASRPWRYGRQRRRKAKRTHIEIIVEESKVKKENKEEKKAGKEPVKAKDGVKKAPVKKEVKPIEKKVEKKEDKK